MLNKPVAIAPAAVMAACGASAQVSNASRLDEAIEAGRLKVCSPGAHEPFRFQKPGGGFEGLDIDLVNAAAGAPGVEVEMVKTAWPKPMQDFTEKCDVAVGGISVSTDRAKTAFFTSAYRVNGTAPITKCENVKKFQTVADIDKPEVTVIENPGGGNERFARAHFRNAKIVIFPANVTIFDEICKGNADVMISEPVETILQQKLRPGLCAVNPEQPLQ